MSNEAPISDLLDEAGELLRRIEARMPRRIEGKLQHGVNSLVSRSSDAAAVAGVLRAAIESADADALDAAREMFYELPDELLAEMLNGWKPAGPRPTRDDVAAATELASIQRVLNIDVTARTIIPSHQWALRDGAAPVRIEIQEGATLAEAIRALEWLAGSLPGLWEKAIDPLGAVVIAKVYQDVDLRNSTYQGVDLRAEKTAR